MGGRKVENALNENRRSRMDCFNHRSKGILKKLYQLAYVSGCGVHLVMEAEDGNVYEFHRRMNPILQRELAEALNQAAAQQQQQHHAANNMMDGPTASASASAPPPSRRNGSGTSTSSTSTSLRAASNKRFFFNGRDILDTGLQVSPAHRAAILDPNAACPCFDCLHGLSSRRFDVLFPFAPPTVPPPSVPENAAVPTPAPAVSTTSSSASLLLPYQAPAPLFLHDPHHPHNNVNAAYHSNAAAASASQTTPPANLYNCPPDPPPPVMPPFFEFLPPQPPPPPQPEQINMYGTPLSSIITNEDVAAASGSISRYSSTSTAPHPTYASSTSFLLPPASFITPDFNGSFLHYQQLLQGPNHQHHDQQLSLLHPPPTFTSLSTVNHPQLPQQQPISWTNNNNNDHYYSSSLLHTTSHASNSNAAVGLDLAVDETTYYCGDGYSYSQMNSNWNHNNNNNINDAYCNASATARILPEVDNDHQQPSAHANINYNISCNGDNNINNNNTNLNGSSCVSDSAAAELHAQFTSFDVTLTEFLEKMMGGQQHSQF